MEKKETWQYLFLDVYEDFLNNFRDIKGAKINNGERNAGLKRKCIFALTI